MQLSYAVLCHVSYTVDFYSNGYVISFVGQFWFSNCYYQKIKRWFTNDGTRNIQVPSATHQETILFISVTLNLYCLYGFVLETLFA